MAGTGAFLRGRASSSGSVLLAYRWSWRGQKDVRLYRRIALRLDPYQVVLLPAVVSAAMGPVRKFSLEALTELRGAIGLLCELILAGLAAAGVAPLASVRNQSSSGQQLCRKQRFPHPERDIGRSFYMIWNGLRDRIIGDVANQERDSVPDWAAMLANFRFRLILLLIRHEGDFPVPLSGITLSGHVYGLNLRAENAVYGGSHHTFVGRA